MDHVNNLILKIEYYSLVNCKQYLRKAKTFHGNSDQGSSCLMRRQLRIFSTAIGHVLRGLISVFMAKTHTHTHTHSINFGNRQLQQHQETTKIHSSRLAFTTCLQRGNGNGWLQSNCCTTDGTTAPPTYTAINEISRMKFVQFLTKLLAKRVGFFKLLKSNSPQLLLSLVYFIYIDIFFLSA